MGASCSASALNKYHALKRYVHSKDCLTFDRVQGWLPRQGYGGGPPIVLIGENHGSNESEHSRKRCVTTLSAMSRIASSCHDPSSKVLFFLENMVLSGDGQADEYLHHYFDRFSVKLPKFLTRQGWQDKHYYETPVSYGEVVQNKVKGEWRPLDSFGNPEAFNLTTVRENVSSYQDMLKMGLSPISTDVFHTIRGQIILKDAGSTIDAVWMDDDTAIKNAKEMVFNIYTLSDMLKFERKRGLGVEQLSGYFSEVDKKMDAKGLLRERYKKGASLYNLMNMPNKTLTYADILKEEDEKKKKEEASMVPGERYRDTSNLIDDIQMYNKKYRGNGVRLKAWMFIVTEWICTFTVDVIEREKKRVVSTRGLDIALQDVQHSIKAFNSKPTGYTGLRPMELLNALTICGDILIYILFFLDHMNAEHSKEIWVVFGGDAHIENIAKWMGHTKYAKDFEIEGHVNA